MDSVEHHNITTFVTFGRNEAIIIFENDIVVIEGWCAALVMRAQKNLYTTHYNVL